LNIQAMHSLMAAFSAHASDVCAQKTIYQKFKLIWH